MKINIFQIRKKYVLTGFVGVFLLLMQLVPVKSQDKNTTPGFSKITLRVADLQKQSNWYQSTFKFKRKTLEKENKIILEKDNFILELIGQKDTITTRKLSLPDQMRFLSRFNKFGFVINNLDELFAQIEQQKIETAGGVFFDERLKFRTFIVKDPEGNMVQFFEPQGFLKELKPPNNEWKPAFLNIITEDSRNTINWYEKNLKFKEIGNLDNPARNIIHRTLFNGKVLLELVEITGKIAGKEKYAEIWKNAGGVISIGFSNAENQKNVFDNSNNLIELIKK